MLFFNKKKVSGVSLETPPSSLDGGVKLEWKKSTEFPFRHAHGGFTDPLKASTASTSCTTESSDDIDPSSCISNNSGNNPKQRNNGTGSTIRNNALRRSSCTRSVMTPVPPRTSALDMLDSTICANHVLVNAERERFESYLRPLRRSDELDELARVQAKAMAKDMETYHSDAAELLSKFAEQPRHCLGENVARGGNIEYIHFKMTNRTSDLANMMDWRFREMGMATALGKDGKIYLCQLFRG